MSDDTIDRLIACLWASEKRNERLQVELADLAQALEGATTSTKPDIDDSRIATVRDCLLRDGEELRQSLALDALDSIERELESWKSENERLNAALVRRVEGDIRRHRRELEGL
jgi:hypothetical protein